MQEAVYKKPGNTDSAILEMHHMIFRIMRNEDLYKNRFDIKFKLLTFRALLRLLKEKVSGPDDQLMIREIEEEMNKYEQYYRERSSRLIRPGGGNGRG